MQITFLLRRHRESGLDQGVRPPTLVQIKTYSQLDMGSSNQMLHPYSRDSKTRAPRGPVIFLRGISQCARISLPGQRQAEVLVLLKRHSEATEDHVPGLGLGSGSLNNCSMFWGPVMMSVYRIIRGQSSW